MVASDTIVGIVGAVVLVAVMAGVFVYEYNNTQTQEGGVEQQQAHFEETYAGLSATQDIDGDGIQNFNDTDLDGDGVNNTEDAQVAVESPVNVQVAAPTGSPTTAQFRFEAGNGTEGLAGTLSYTRSAGGQVPVVSATLTGPAGFEARTLSFTQRSGGATYDAQVAIEESLPAGEYTLTFTNQGPGGLVPVGQPATVTGSLEVRYASPSLEDAHEHPVEK